MQRHGRRVPARVDGAGDDTEGDRGEGWATRRSVTQRCTAIGNTGVLGNTRGCSARSSGDVISRPGEVNTNLHQPMLTGAAANVRIERRTTRQHPTSSTPVVPREVAVPRGPQAPGAPPLRSGLPSKNTGGRRGHRYDREPARRHRRCPLPAGLRPCPTNTDRPARGCLSDRFGAPSCDRRDRVPDDPHTCIRPRPRDLPPPVTSSSETRMGARPGPGRGPDRQRGGAQWWG
jgi:hypothetical protein